MSTTLVPYTEEYRESLANMVNHRYWRRYTNRGCYALFSLFRIYHSDLFLLRKDNDIVGCIVLRSKLPLIHPRDIWIYGVFVLPSCRGCGYGKEMMKLVMDRNRQKNIYLWVKNNNPIAISMYKGLGFAEIDMHREMILMKYDAL